MGLLDLYQDRARQGYAAFDGTFGGVLPGGSTFDSSLQGRSWDFVGNVLDRGTDTIGKGAGNILRGTGDGLGDGLMDVLKPLAIAAGIVLLGVVVLSKNPIKKPS